MNDARGLAGNPAAVLPQETRTRELDFQIRIIEKNTSYYLKPRRAEDREERLPEQIRLTAYTGFSILATADPERICNKAGFKKFLLQHR